MNTLRVEMFRVVDMWGHIHIAYGTGILTDIFTEDINTDLRRSMERILWELNWP